MMKNPSVATSDAMINPVASAAAVVATAATTRTEANGADADGSRGRHGVAGALGNLLRLALLVVRIHHTLRLTAHRIDEARAVVVEPPRVLADDAVAILAAAVGEMRRDALPLPQVHLDQPVDELGDLAFDLLRRVGDDLLFERLLDAALD